MEFNSLQTLAKYIENEYLKDSIDTYTWNNDAGDWDIEDIALSYIMYDSVYSSYYLDIRTMDIYGYTKPYEKELIFNNIG